MWRSVGRIEQGNRKEKIEKRKSIDNRGRNGSGCFEGRFSRSPEEGGRQSDVREMRCVVPTIFLVFLEEAVKRPSRSPFTEPPRRATRISMPTTRAPSRS